MKEDPPCSLSNYTGVFRSCGHCPPPSLPRCGTITTLTVGKHRSSSPLHLLSLPRKWLYRRRGAEWFSERVCLISAQWRISGGWITTFLDINNCFVSQQLSERDLRELRECFLQAFDFNNDGKIEIREVCHKIVKLFILFRHIYNVNSACSTSANGGKFSPPLQIWQSARLQRRVYESKLNVKSVPNLMNILTLSFPANIRENEYYIAQSSCNIGFMYLCCLFTSVVISALVPVWQG